MNMHHFDDEDAEESAMRGCTDKKTPMVIDDNMIEKSSKNRNMILPLLSIGKYFSNYYHCQHGLKRGQPNTILIFVGGCQ